MGKGHISLKQSVMENTPFLSLFIQPGSTADFQRGGREGGVYRTLHTKCLRAMYLSIEMWRQNKDKRPQNTREPVLQTASAPPAKRRCVPRNRERARQALAGQSLPTSGRLILLFPQTFRTPPGQLACHSSSTTNKNCHAAPAFSKGRKDKNASPFLTATDKRG